MKEMPLNIVGQTPTLVAPLPCESQERIIYCDGDFSEFKVNDVIRQLIKFEVNDPTKDILIIINSYGGYVDGFIAMHDAIKMCRCDVATLCLGKSMSCGQMLLISGTKGKRFITENSRTLVHEIWSGSFGKLSELDNNISETRRLQSVLESLILKYTKINKKKLGELMEKDSYLTAKESLSLGIVDYIVSCPKDIYSRISI